MPVEESGLPLRGISGNPAAHHRLYFLSCGRMTKGRGKNNNYNGGRGGYGQSGGGYNTRSTMDINQLAANDPFADLLGTSAVASAALPSSFAAFGGGSGARGGAGKKDLARTTVSASAAQ